MQMEGKTVPVDEEFIRSLAQYIQASQKRSIIVTIEFILEQSAISTPSLLLNTDTLFPNNWSLDPKVARFMPEVYACIDQLLLALTLAAEELHRSLQATDDEKERVRVGTVAEILKCVATHVYAARTLSFTGLDVQVRQIVRTYVEHVELLALVCAEPTVLDDFLASDEPNKVNAFWHRHLSKFKARKKRLLNSILKANAPPEEQERRNKWYDEESRLLSECAHPTPYSVEASGRLFKGPYIAPENPDNVIGSLIYVFSMFADALEVPTIEFLQTKLDSERGREICSRFYLIIMLSVILGYRKDHVFFGASDLEKDIEKALNEA